MEGRSKEGAQLASIDTSLPTDRTALPTLNAKALPSTRKFYI